MDEEIREDIEKENEVLNDDEDVLYWYDHETELRIRYEETYREKYEKLYREEYEQKLEKLTEKKEQIEKEHEILKEKLEKEKIAIAKNEKMNIAKKMLDKNIGIQDIAQITGLDISEINNIFY